MTGYSRADTADNIANNKVANADDLDNEFNAVQSAFNSSTGHTHDGTSGSGAPITKLGPVQDVIVTTSQLYPKTTNTVDLGTSSLQYKDLWIDGIANIDSLVADTADINAGTIDATVIGATTPAAASFTTISSTAGITGNITSSGTSTFATVDINGGAVDGTVIGATTPASAAFTTVTATSINSAVASSNATITGGSINATPIGATTPSTGVFTSISSTTGITGNLTGAVTGNASTATKLATARTISLSGDVAGSVSFDGSANVNIVATVQPDSVALGTDTTGNYVAGVSGTANQITVTSGTGEGVSPVLSLPSAVTLPGTLTTVGSAIIGGDLIVNGTTTTVNSNTVNIADSIITLNSDEVGTPSQNAGIEIERGTSANVSWLWDEANDRWTSAGNVIHTTGGFVGNVTGNTAGTHTGAVSSSAATITGGSITGITDLAIADGGTGASTAAGALTNLGLTATAAELNIMDGVVTTTAEINYLDGVTSAIQTQLNTKAALASPALTGTPTAPTAASGTNTTQVATTAFVTNKITASIATQVQAEAGIDNTTLMTPLRSAQAISALSVIADGSITGAKLANSTVVATKLNIVQGSTPISAGGGGASGTVSIPLNTFCYWAGGQGPNIYESAGTATTRNISWSGTNFSTTLYWRYFA